jgi:hypothetical protein
MYLDTHHPATETIVSKKLNKKTKNKKRQKSVVEIHLIATLHQGSDGRWLHPCSPQKGGDEGG